MIDIFGLKTILMTPLIKLIVKHPGIMKSRLFLKAMQVFPEKVSKTYDKKIKHSDIVYQTPLSQGLDHVKQDPKRILDLCTGTGFAAFLAANYFPKAFVEAVDQSEGMIRISKEKCKKNCIDNVVFKIGNATQLHYADDQFDLIITSNAPIYLSEAARVLKPGGEILVAYSFGGNAFANAEKAISLLLSKNGLILKKIISSKNGASILGKK